jgi:hypothetical protein
MTLYEDRHERRRHFFRRNLAWIAPLGVVAGAGLFIGLGFLVVWLWRVTLSDIFGVKTISFWQAWGLVLLSQILFKANVHRSVGAGPMQRRVLERAAERAGGPEGPATGV